MALERPSTIDVTDIQFKVHDRFTVFNAGQQLRSHVNLLATASNYGLMFVGNPNEAELKVIVIKDLIESKASGKGLHARQVQLPNQPNCIAVSSDGSMLAVNYTQNGCGFVAIYSVPSFTKANIKSLHNIRLPGDESISALQLLWNPVISGSLAVVMSNGALGMYDFKNGAYEMHTLDSKEQILCGSWSPKGKQIVLGFPNGKLAQYKPDLKLARTIPCPPNIHPGPFDTISVQWLSTFQFAVVFLQRAEDATPYLYIVHAPKAGNPSYTNYFDICYSFTGPRAQQVNLMHIQQWNLLLVTSANGVEVGLLGTKETTEAPTWVQYTLLDEARIEMPLTDKSDETYPIGFALDTSSTHQLTIAEKKLPVMPMIHTLSTHGQLVAFNFLNLQPNTPDICSPPPPISDTSGMSQFKPVSEMLNQKKPEITMPAATMPLTVVSQPAPAELSFAPLGGTSTPALEKPKAIFGAPMGQPSTGSIMFGAPQSGWAPSFAPVASAPATLFKTTAPVKTTPQQPSIGFGDLKKQQEQVQQPAPNVVNPDKNKPLFTVQPSFNPPPVVVPSQQQSTAPQTQQIAKAPAINESEVDDIVNEMILFQITSFDLELKKLTNHSKGLLNNIGNMEEMKEFTKRLNNLQDIVDQANEKELESDLRCLLNSLNESCAMMAECRSKLNMYKYPDIAILKNASNFDPINRRQLAKLQSLLAKNQAQIQIIQNQIDSQWADFQDMVKRNSRTHMHTPYLEGIYQRMTKLKDMIARNRTKMNYYKSKLKQYGLLYNQSQVNSNGETTMESLTDTILSMSLGPTVQENSSKLTKEKVAALRGVLTNRKISIIKPQRPDQVGLKSEVILETKLKSDRKLRDGAATNMNKMEQERIRNEQQRVLTKPTATKAIAPSMAAISQPNAPTSFGFGAASPFVKPNPGKLEDYRKDQSQQQPQQQQMQPQQQQQQQQQQPMIVKPVASTAGPMFLKATPNTSAPANSSAFSGFGTSSNPGGLFSGMSITPSAMPAFTGFGTNSSLAFGSPKPLTANQQAKEPIPAADKVQKDQKPTLAFDSKPMTSENKPFATPNFSSSFTAVAPSKNAEQVDKENKLPDSFIPVGAKSETSSLTISSTSTQPLGFGSGVAATSAPSSVFSFATASAPAKAPTSTSTAPFAFSFGSAFNSASETSTTTTTSKPPMFGGLPKPTPTTAVKSEVAAVFSADQEKLESLDSGDSTGFTFSSLNLGTLGLPATPNLSPTPSVSTPESSSGSSVTVVKTSNASISDPNDSLFSSLNICKPTTAENAFKPAFGDGNMFGSASFTTESSTETKSIFGSTAVSKESTGFGGFGLSSDSSKSAFEATTTPASTAESSSTSTTTTSTTTSTATLAPKTTQTITFGTAPPAQGSITTGQVAASTSAQSVFATSSASPASIFSSAAAATTTATSGTSIFGGTGLTFGVPAQTGTPSIFGSLATTQTSAAGESSFAAISPPAATSTAAPAFGTGSTTSSASSLFASAAAATTPPVSSSSASIFGGIPKPDQSVFGQPEGTTVFGSPTNTESATSGGSLFGSQSGGFGAPSNTSSGGSIFGGGSSAAQPSSPFSNANTGGNIFSSPTASSAPSVFGTPAQPTTAPSGSIFDQSSNSGQSGGSLFGGNQTQGFGAPTSPFSAAASSGGSIFGGGASATSPKPSAFSSPAPAASTFGSANTGGFGLFSQTPAFGSPSQPNANTGGGSFAQGGSSITQSGFGSPNSGTAFAKPVFGGAPAFGGATTFGSPPSFGSAPSFGSPKGFGSFAAPAATAGAFNSPTQNNNLFEALGSSDTGLTFGNLAQNNNPNQQKPAFGGSSFMSYRS
ncbi:nuclear pore complex protein Nup214 [Episyrphus balteatus]|uniref:nuclear pore complex protein Nup214 n=1 Tax=Episyrphus balteatus TaxID=286459 RepID=UPI002484FC62|nr:nuclear pore complex protein Nup214 [Episyrphus balteatus]